ncbi:hypothetical protein BH09BAC2_BH09BAC2_01630 [soil metagenome]
MLLTVLSLSLLTVLLVFGKTEAHKSTVIHNDSEHKSSFNINQLITQSKGRLTQPQLLYLTELENSVKRGDVKEQLIKEYYQLAGFWKDTVGQFVPYAYYTAEAAKLDNSEKNLTFAARLLLENLRREENPELKAWEAEQAVELFEKALKIDPDNDDLKIGLGSCYVYGKGMIGDASETMKGIQTLLQVARKDSNNMKAQLMLGIGGVISGQFDKAIVRLNKVIAFDNKNLEAVSWLADAYAQTGDKVKAIQWYEYSKKLVNDPEYSAEVNERINALKK